MKNVNFILLFLFSFIFIEHPITAQWTSSNGPYGGDVQSILANGSNIFIGTKYGIYRSSNNGASWTEMNNGLTSTHVLSLAVAGNSLLAGTIKGIFISSDNGQNWKAINTGLTSTYIWDIQVSGQNIYIGTNGGGVFYF